MGGHSSAHNKELLGRHQPVVVVGPDPLSLASMGQAGLRPFEFLSEQSWMCYCPNVTSSDGDIIVLCVVTYSSLVILDYWKLPLFWVRVHVALALAPVLGPCGSWSCPLQHCFWNTFPFLVLGVFKSVDSEASLLGWKPGFTTYYLCGVAFNKLPDHFMP